MGNLLSTRLNIINIQNIFRFFKFDQQKIIYPAEYSVLPKDLVIEIFSHIDHDRRYLWLFVSKEFASFVKFYYGDLFVYNISRTGELELLKWAILNGCKLSSTVCSIAAFHGHFEILKWARKNGCRWDSWVCKNACEYGHFEILKWARKNGCELNYEKCVYLAAKNNHLEILQWLEENKSQETNIIEEITDKLLHGYVLGTVQNECLKILNWL